jgi:hypothetical protein
MGEACTSGLPTRKWQIFTNVWFGEAAFRHKKQQSRPAISKAILSVSRNRTFAALRNLSTSGSNQTLAAVANGD